MRHTHTVEVYPNSVVHRGNRGAPRAIHVQERQRTCKCNIETCLRNYCCRGKSRNCYTFLVCVCSLSYPVGKAHAPYHIVICGLSGPTVFSTLSGTNFGRKLLNVKCVFDCFYNFCSLHFLL
jgi:hypothetical protein